MSSTIKKCQHCKQDVPVRENGTAVPHFTLSRGRWNRKTQRILCKGSDKPA